MDPTTWGLEEAKLIVTSVIAIVAAGFGIAIQMGMKRIAVRQAETARQAMDVATAKLKLDLFEKRLAIFQQAWSVIGYAASGRPYDFAKLGALQNKLHEAGFLFGKDIEEYLLNLRSKAFEEQQLLTRIDKEGMYVDQSVRDQHKILQEWFLQESKNIQTPFLPYMSFEKWRA
jgi:uncharacterized protein YebE (UPF0316 family)